MNLRKLIALFATLIVMTGTMMSGTAFAAPTDEAAQAEEVTLKWLGIGPGIQRDAEEVWALWNEELQSHLPGVTVEFELHPPYEYADRFKLAMAANEQIDVANRMWMMNFFQEIDRGALMPLNDLLEEYGQGILDAVPSSPSTRSRSTATSTTSRRAGPPTGGRDSGSTRSSPTRPAWRRRAAASPTPSSAPRRSTTCWRRT